MSVHISKMTDKGYLVNGKALYQDVHGVWTSEQKLEYYEISAFKQFLKSIYPTAKNVIAS
ncbi:hypothetical protein QP519_11470 [Weeksella virosa]|uniref:hypothetical protein n=1 Tax=Weeksella virosa TaxID=1014 RepID=UPI0025554CDD|nr:hypothetical protein [Weeksella virosa]MDK7376146.1 hypothetical protein [Weeksella virosa]